MISIFLLWTFHLYVATFQQQLHMEHISLCWSDIPDLVVPINNHDFLDRELLLTRKLLNQGFLVDKLKSSLRKFFDRQDNLVNHCDTSVTNDHRYVPFVVKITWLTVVIHLSQMTTDMFLLLLSQTGPVLVHDYSPGLLQR